MTTGHVRAVRARVSTTKQGPEARTIAWHQEYLELVSLVMVVKCARSSTFLVDSVAKNAECRVTALQALLLTSRRGGRTYDELPGRRTKS
eukprot:scaffold966_cov415-Prasinococcus_capsulatus_cf.AAC.12